MRHSSFQSHTQESIFLENPYVPSPSPKLSANAIWHPGKKYEKGEYKKEENGQE
jgi:hypothetical protein